MKLVWNVWVVKFILFVFESCKYGIIEELKKIYIFISSLRWACKNPEFSFFTSLKFEYHQHNFKGWYPLFSVSPCVVFSITEKMELRYRKVVYFFLLVLVVATSLQWVQTMYDLIFKKWACAFLIWISWNTTYYSLVFGADNLHLLQNWCVFVRS